MTMTPNLNHGMSHDMPQGPILTGDVQ
jgi:hypothetical protein